MPIVPTTYYLILQLKPQESLNYKTNHDECHMKHKY